MSDIRSGELQDIELLCGLDAEQSVVSELKISPRLFVKMSKSSLFSSKEGRRRELSSSCLILHNMGSGGLEVLVAANASMFTAGFALVFAPSSKRALGLAATALPKLTCNSGDCFISLVERVDLLN